MNAYEKKLRKVIAQLEPKDMVVAKVTQRDVEEFRAGILTYSDDTPESVAKRLEGIKKRG